MDQKLPPELIKVREIAKKALGSLVPAGDPKSDEEARGLMLSSRTEAGRGLPDYYLVYFLLVDLLGFSHVGPGEKSAWIVPVRIEGRLYGIEHAKSGLGVFAPTLEPSVTKSGRPTSEAEADAKKIVALIRRAVIAAEPYFVWRAEFAAKGIDLNVKNRSTWLFSRYQFFREQYLSLKTERETAESERKADLEQRMSESTSISLRDALSLGFAGNAPADEAEWCAQAAIEAFFSWTEHVFIHLGILQGHVRTGEKVAELASFDWKAKFKVALNLSDPATKKHYDALMELRFQVRNFMAHGAFGKRGEAFDFHSGAGAVPVLLTGSQQHRFALSGNVAFAEAEAIAEIDRFIEHLWTDTRSPAQEYLASGIPTILSYANDGTYLKAMESESEMSSFLEHLQYQIDTAANMDF